MLEVLIYLYIDVSNSPINTYAEVEESEETDTTSTANYRFFYR